MRAYSAMPTSEFIAQLRDIAINANARPQVIDQIDAILDGPTEEEIEEREAKAAEEGKADAYKEWREAIFQAVDTLDSADLRDAQYKAMLALLENIDPMS